MDAAIFSVVNSAHSPGADAVMTALSRAGYGASVWFALALAAMLWPRHRAAAARAVLALAVTLGVNDQIVKPIVDRPRPFVGGVVDARVIQRPAPTTASFPSGHSATAAAGALSLARVWPSARWALWTLGALIAFSRIYVGVHYPTDVAAGVLLGVACAWLVLGGRHASTWSRAVRPAADARYVP